MTLREEKAIINAVKINGINRDLDMVKNFCKMLLNDEPFDVDKVDVKLIIREIEGIQQRLSKISEDINYPFYKIREELETVKKDRNKEEIQ